MEVRLVFSDFGTVTLCIVDRDIVISGALC